MGDLEQRVVQALGLELPDDVVAGSREAHDRIVRRARASAEGHRRAAERAQLWETRFAELAKVAGDDAARAACEAVPTQEKMNLLRWLDPTSKDFMGSGLSLSEILMRGDIERYRRAFASQEHDERKRRLRIVIRASAHYLTICTFDTCGTALLEMAIEEILAGEDPVEFSERVGWSEREERPSWDSMTEQEAAAYRIHEADRLALWLPALRTLHEYSDAFFPVDDVPAFDSLAGMIAAQDELCVIDLGEPMIVRSEDVPTWHSRWAFHLMHLHMGLVERLFIDGVRWQPSKGYHSGFWYRVDKSPFPGTSFHRIFDHEQLLRWHQMHTKTDDATATD